MKRAEIERLLPVVFQRTIRPGNPLFGLLEVMEGLHAPSEAVIERLDDFFDPRRTPDAFVPFLASWVDLDRFFAEPVGSTSTASGTREPISTGIGRVRELVAAAATLSKWRGTKRGMLLFLQTATGLADFEIDEQVLGPDGQLLHFHIRVRAPAAVASHKALIEHIIEIEKPAYVTYELIFTPAGGGPAI